MVPEIDSYSIHAFAGGGAAGDIPWLTLDPTAGVVFADGGTVDVTLTFDSTGPGLGRLLWRSPRRQCTRSQVHHPRAVTCPALQLDVPAPYPAQLQLRL